MHSHQPPYNLYTSRGVCFGAPTLSAIYSKLFAVTLVPGLVCMGSTGVQKLGLEGIFPTVYWALKTAQNSLNTAIQSASGSKTGIMGGHGDGLGVAIPTPHATKSCMHLGFGIALHAPLALWPRVWGSRLGGGHLGGPAL